MKKRHWFLLLLSAILYATPFVCVDLFWWIIFIFPVPLLYITCIQNLSFFHGYVWGIFVFLFHLHSGIVIITNLAGDSWWIGLLMGGAMVLYQALMPALLFWCTTKITLFFSIESPIVRLLLWTGALALFIFWTDQCCMWIFDMQGYPFMHPLLPLTQNPSLLCLLPIMGKKLLLMLFLLVPASIVMVLWYKNGISVVLCLVAITPWIWWGMHQTKHKNQPDWYKEIASLPCMIRGHNASGALRILAHRIKKLIATYPDASIIIMPESALDIIDEEILAIANITLFNRPEFSPALALNLLKGFSERSKIPFNKFRASAKINILGCLEGMCYIWHQHCEKKSLHLICGTCVDEDSHYYNSLYWIHNGLLQARFDKKHIMLMTERLVDWMNVDFLRNIYFKDGISITASCNERKLLQISQSVAFVPYICSELFFYEHSDDSYLDKPIIAIVNDTLLIDSSMHSLLVLLARFKAIQWQRDIVYVSYRTSVCIDKQGMRTAIHA